MNRLILVLSFLVFSSSSIFSQLILPKGFAPGEKDKMSNYIEEVQSEARDSDPPESPVRIIAEWEELEGVLITWTSFPSILSQIVDAVQKETSVYIVCTNQTSVINYLNSQGIEIGANVFFIEDDFDSIWVRDYGPNSGYLNNVEELVFVDWIYNRPRYKDNAVPVVLGEYMDVPVYSTDAQPNDLVNTGGNFMADGMGKGFSSELVLTENGPNNDFGMSNHDEEAVDDIMELYMGIDEYIKMEVLPYDLIHHIDMHMKLIDENTIMMGEYPEGVADGPQIEANLLYVLENFKAAFGRDFKVVRMPMPPSGNGNYPDQWNADYRTYTNSLFVNKTILVPTYEEQYDTTALRIWKETMPGYNIVGIDCNDIIPLSGALHCITKEIGSKDPLQISHVPLDDVEASDNADYFASAIVRHKSGIDNVTLHYWTNSNPDIQSIELEASAQTDDAWEGNIPEQALETIVYYYFEANAASGKNVVRPLPAPEGYFSFKVGDTEVNNDDTNANLLVVVGEMFPNPVKNIAAIPFSLTKTSSVSLEVFDLNGKLIEQLPSMVYAAGENHISLVCDDYQAGNYILALKVGDKTYTQQFSVQ